MSEQTPLELIIKREFKYPAKIVFEAWLDPKQLMQWMGPTPDINLNLCEIDPNEKGTYRFGFVQDNEPTLYVSGKYATITRYTLLVFSWTWENHETAGGVETLVTITFEAIDDNTTQLSLHHQKFGDQETCDHHNMGWNGTFDKLTRHLDKQ